MRRKGLIGAVAGVAILGIATGVYVVAVPSGGEEEAVRQVATATPTASASRSPSPTATTLPTLSPLPSQPPIPADWATYAGPGLTLRYPSGWHALKDGGIYSWDPATWNKPYFPPESVKVDIIYGSSEFAEPRPTEAADFSIAASSGWEITYPKDPATSDGLTRVHQVALQRGAFTLFIIAYFSQTSPDEATFLNILNSLSFAN